jgi:hypothetical protein
MKCVPAASSLIAKVNALWTAGVLNDGQVNSLLSKLDGILKAIENDKPSADNKLRAFINEAEGFINGGTLAAADGQVLIDRANYIINWLAGATICPYCGALNGTHIPPCDGTGTGL